MAKKRDGKKKAGITDNFFAELIFQTNVVRMKSTTVQSRLHPQETSSLRGRGRELSQLSMKLHPPAQGKEKGSL